MGLTWMIIGFDNNRCYGKMVYVFGKLIHNYRRWYRWCRLGQASNRAVFIGESAATATERKKCTPFLLSFRLRYLFGFYMFVVLRFLRLDPLSHLIYCYCLFDLGFLLLSVMSLLLSHCYVGHCHRFWFVISFLICCCCCFPHYCGLF